MEHGTLIFWTSGCVTDLYLRNKKRDNYAIYLWTSAFWICGWNFRVGITFSEGRIWTDRNSTNCAITARLSSIRSPATSPPRAMETYIITCWDQPEHYDLRREQSSNGGMVHFRRLGNPFIADDFQRVWSFVGSEGRSHSIRV